MCCGHAVEKHVETKSTSLFTSHCPRIRPETTPVAHIPVPKNINSIKTQIPPRGTPALNPTLSYFPANRLRAMSGGKQHLAPSPGSLYIPSISISGKKKQMAGKNTSTSNQQSGFETLHEKYVTH
jgi:hypothetical protein